jgi:glucose/arabinose dehydrogenase
VVEVAAQSEFAPGERFREDVIVEGIPIPTAITFAPDSRMFLALKEGIVRVVDNGALLPAPFVDISAIVNRSTDRGLLGIAVDPSFPTKPYVYLSYVYDPPGVVVDGKDPRVVRVVRYTADAEKNYNVAVPFSEKIILGKNSTADNMAGAVPVGDPNTPERASCMTGLTMAGAPIKDCIPADALSHTAGTLFFGADRSLYASFGDAANYDFPSTLAFRAQSLDAMSGRVVRVDPDTGNGLSGNPFFDPAAPDSNRSRVWSRGLRNPFRITISPINGEVYSGDVGTSYYEEINSGKGSNHGWPCYEGGFSDSAQQEGVATLSQKQVGFKKAPSTVDFCNQMYVAGSSKVRAPLFTYRHPYDATGKDLGSSVTGVAVYNGDAYPARFKGSLFYADYARKFIRYLTFDPSGVPTTHNFATEIGSALGAVQLSIGPDTNLYAVYLDLRTRTGQVRRFRALEGSNNPPAIKASASPLGGNIPLLVSFSSTGTADPDGQELNYSWDFGDGSSSRDANPTHVYSKVGTYSVKLTVQEATAPFDLSTRMFTIRTGVTPPIAFIDQPTADVRYQIGVPVSFSGHTDPSVGVEMSWAVLQRHNLHEHLVSEISGSSGAFIPEEHCDNCGYELCLMAIGEGGLIDQKCREVPPLTTAYTFASKPPGASITYIDEEKEVLAPYVAQPIVGSKQTISAAPISVGRTFVRWADGVTDPVRAFTTGPIPMTFTAIYLNKVPKLALKLVRGSSKTVRTIKLDASATIDPEGEPLRYTWVFSDRRRMRGPVVARRFSRSGSYSVTLTVSDRLGGTVVYKGRLSVGRRSSIRKLSLKPGREI